MNTQSNAISMWSPLRSSTYAVLFLATVASNIGTWMHEVGASWLMTELTQDPARVALIQTAVALPIFLFALPAGALADLIDRRRLLIGINIFACVLAVILATLVQFGMITPALLLLLTFMLGVCAAFIAPAWQAIVPSLVSKDQLSAAVSLNGVGINISRAIGPALAGALIVSLGIQAPFWLNSISFLFILFALWWWKPASRPESGLPKEHILPAMLNGLKYARHSKPLRATLIRAIAFFIAVSAFWALLPIIVSQGLEAEASLFGLATALVGVGALCGAMLLPRLKKMFKPGTLLLIVSFVDAALLAILALTFTQWALLVSCFVFGAAWIIALANLNVSAQTALPNWVRARGLAVFLTVFFGAMSLGSVIWGNVATFVSLSETLLISSGVLVLGSLLTSGFALNLGSDKDLEPSLHWPTPKLHQDTDVRQPSDRKPVMVTIEYQISKRDWSAFILAIEELGNARKRYGAYQWGIMQDAENPERFTEYFFETSWLQHLHHHERTSGEDRECQVKVNEFHYGDQPPRVRHLLGVAKPKIP